MVDHDKLDSEVARARGQEQLANEAESRNKRVTTRRGVQAKKELARRAAKRKRMFKVIGIWVGVIFVGFLGTAWFMPSMVAWVKGMMK
jgi:hypothetical protein